MGIGNIDELIPDAQPVEEDSEPELPDPNKLITETDARVWAKTWIETIKNYPEIPNDESTMTTWFSMAISAGYDKGRGDTTERIGSI